METETEALGVKSEFELIHPELLLFVDEVGSNTCQTKDGQVGGETYLCNVDGRPQQKAATMDCRFTTLGFTAATGEPVMYAVIFEGKTSRKNGRQVWIFLLIEKAKMMRLRGIQVMKKGIQTGQHAN